MRQSPLRNSGGKTPSPPPRIQQNTPPLHHFHSTIFVQKLRCFNTLILVFRFAAFWSFAALPFSCSLTLRAPIPLVGTTLMPSRMHTHTC
ncbi:hypothetical protein RHMOL_Rhmol08G0157500 [Rhododendron molle]|uniref:Uncharacterized protein n=1 Tax=Rhododendron molle TaxID=49168 RepID=A0ACC0MQC9_RHOML|nr:hypothetical protein RHMOL_Rhmol08G0157500 [Rhododendron molle]